jgi:hypothetical protein
MCYATDPMRLPKAAPSHLLLFIQRHAVGGVVGHCVLCYRDIAFEQLTRACRCVELWQPCTWLYSSNIVRVG